MYIFVAFLVIVPSHSSSGNGTAVVAAEPVSNSNLNLSVPLSDAEITVKAYFKTQWQNVWETHRLTRKFPT